MGTTDAASFVFSEVQPLLYFLLACISCFSYLSCLSFCIYFPDTENFLYLNMNTQHFRQEL